MAVLYFDVLKYIFSYADDVTKNKFILCSKETLSFRFFFLYHDQINYYKIEHLKHRECFDQFTNLIIYENPIKYPKNLNILTVDSNQYPKDLVIPGGITHLTFGHGFNSHVKCLIPHGVTHLTFGKKYNHDIHGAIPPTVTHLDLGDHFNKNIKGLIPNSVTHLTFGRWYTQSIKDAIPANVTHLIIKTNQYHLIRDFKGNIPNTVTHLTLQIEFQPGADIKGLIPEGVTHLKFGYYCAIDLTNAIPVSVTHLTLRMPLSENFYDMIPKTVTDLFLPSFTQVNTSDIKAHVTYYD